MITDLWARAQPLLESALVHARGTHELSDVLAAVGEGRLQLWIGTESVAVSEIMRFPRLSTLNVFLAAGKMGELHECLPGMKAFARGAMCSRIVFSGRLDAVDGRKSGWEVLMPEFTPSHVVMCLELD